MTVRRTATPASAAVPVLLTLTLRRHIDLARVSSATCR
ncbi:putative leader peptide [Streptomyces sp. 35G-GA-8]